MFLNRCVFPALDVCEIKADNVYCLSFISINFRTMDSHKPAIPLAKDRPTDFKKSIGHRLPLEPPKITNICITPEHRKLKKRQSSKKSYRRQRRKSKTETDRRDRRNSKQVNRSSQSPPENKDNSDLSDGDCRSIRPHTAPPCGN